MKRILQSRSVWVSIALILLGVLMPKWLGPSEIGLDRLIMNVELNGSGSSLMVAAFHLVGLNTMILFPYYLGVFILGEQIGEISARPWLKVAIPLVVVPLVHFTINLTVKYSFYFGSDHILILITIVILQKLGRERLRFMMKSIVMAQLLFGVLWFNLIPLLSPLGFGYGSFSMRTKQLSVIIGFDQVLTLYAFVLGFIFILNAIILAVFIGVHAERWSMKEELHRTQLEAVESRSGREMMHLVHDLKTPLTTIEGLVSLIEMRCKDEKIKEYSKKIYSSIRSMSDMISEILYENQKSWCSLKDLIDYVRASRLSGTGALIEVDMPEETNILIWINKIRMTRALVNLIDNAFDVVDGNGEGKVMLLAKLQGNQLWLGVKDNGPGIAPEAREKVWEAGFSTKQHPGLGLSFVRQVAKGHGASVVIDSRLGLGTTFWIQLPKGGVMHEDSNY